MEKICVIGLGYIGLPLAGLLANNGFNVHGVDNNVKIVATINNGGPHIQESGLDILVKTAIQNGHLVAALQPVPADVFIIAVPSLITEKHLPDLKHIQEAIHSIAPHLTPGNLIILETTVPVGTTEKIAGWISELRRDLYLSQLPAPAAPLPGATEKQIFLAHCPERVLPGQILKELMENDRIIGGINQLSGEKARAFYQKFVSGGLLLTDARTAELTKLAENSFRDVNIALANELSYICDKFGINVWELIKLANRHPRVNIHQPGPGVGGHCITKDPWFIIDAAPDESKIIRAAREINDNRTNYVAARVKEKAACFKNPVIACLGLSYKANTGDLRESPALRIVQQLIQETVGQFLIVEPHLKTLPECLTQLNSVQLVNLQEALPQADLVILLVNHNAFQNIDHKLLKNKVVIDTRGTWRQ
ncbi:UDP-N-acetyl-D-mannosaminuronic acid dehydrogenase [Desulfotomaculum arcticum]|uniref:UDP-N-acetyl-D-mannosaminuronic acid dehydrogenase n=1 Tax=Desulfotruncus arcticus DSM 17038 TaxID=1121424 RepID=A0A1I2VJC8_9FIRM|nr:UDP-N-acetyl-D-mannosamine dehydrogenase [Desulfotruncus arcticus]SFG89272.1 UDP-N-acetyl-D-mannosaminuronic acid dehydrogenase [Desulfotomaculum arcticum] [Desulfotruncus arcticus DSM 17038]